MLSRLAAPFLKPTLALLASLAVGGAWADITWTGLGGDTNWETTGNWSAYDTTTGMVLDHSGVSDAYEIDISSNPTRAGYIWVSADKGATLKSSGSFGLNQTSGDIRVGTWANGKLTIDGGTHLINSLVVASGWWANFAPVAELNVKGGAEVTVGWNALGDTDSDTTQTTHNPSSSGTINVEYSSLALTSDLLVGRLAYGYLNVNNGGTVTCQGADGTARWTVVGEQATGNGTININEGGTLAVWHIQKGAGSAAVNFNGGTLKTLGNTGNCEYIIGNDGAPATGPTVTINGKGGIFDSNGLDTKVGVAVTGVGTITKKGTGTLTFSGDMSGFIGRVAVASGAGSVTLPATATRARAGDYTAVTTNQDGTFTFAYDSTGSAATIAVVKLLDLNFEDEATYNSGWTVSGTGNEAVQGSRPDKSSRFLRLKGSSGGGPRQTLATYSLALSNSEESYTFSCDWFAAMGFHESTCYLKLMAGDDLIFSIVDPNAQSAKNNTAFVYGNLSESSLGTFTSAERETCLSETRSEFWYRVKVEASRETGVALTISKMDETVVFGPQKVSEYVLPNKIMTQVESTKSGSNSYGGIDDIVVSVPAIASVDGTNYRTFAEAVAAAISTSTITLYKDVELTSSVELPYGVTLAFNGNILYTTDSDVAVTFSDGAHYLDSATAGGIKTFSSTVLIYDSMYVWTGAVNGAWENLGNWATGAGVTPSDLPGTANTVVFPADANVTLGENQSVAVMNIYGMVNFLGGKQITLDEVGGSGVLQSTSLTLCASADKDLTFDSGLTIDIPQNGSLTTKATSQYHHVFFRSSITGHGTLFLDQGNTQQKGAGRFYGDLSGFHGAVTVTNYRSAAHRDDINIYAGANNSEDVTWTVWGNDNNKSVLASSSTTYKMGALNGYLYVRGDSMNYATLEIGAKNVDCSFGGSFTKDGAGRNRLSTIRKVGTAQVEFTGDGANLANYEIQNGVLLLNSANAFGTAAIKFIGSGATLGIGDSVATDVDPSGSFSVSAGVSFAISNATERTFATAIGSGTTGGFTKKGAGALTLSQPPTYTGTTKVEAGVLYVINGEYSLPLDASTAEVTTDKDGYRKFVPASVTVAAPTVVWGNDFETATISAAVTSNYGEGGLAYNLKIGGNVVEGAVGTIENGVVTFSDVDVSELSISPYGNVSVEVTATAVGSQAVTSGATTAMLADSEGWVDEKKSTTGTTGSWKTTDGAAATVTYDNETERAELSDNKFSATNCSTGDVVTVTIKDVIYTALSDTSAVDADAQGSVALGGTESAPKFMVLTKSGNEVQWSEAAGVDPALNTSYTIVFTFDYNNNKYSITVNGAALTVAGSATYDIVKTTNKYVKDIDFLGAGSIKAIEGIQYDAMMAVDQNGVRYATVADALNANKGVKGAIIKLLHGTANTNIAGWNYNADTMTFIKKAVGLIFLAF